MRPHPVFQVSLFTIGLLAAALAHAQAAPAPAAGVARDEAPLDRNTQRIEHIRVEDAGSRVNEVRVGGQTKSISVQPKAAVPSYDVQPADPSGASAGSRESGPGSAGRRVWKLHQF